MSKLLSNERHQAILTCAPYTLLSASQVDYLVIVRGGHAQLQQQVTVSGGNVLYIPADDGE